MQPRDSNPAIPASERSQTKALDREAIRIGRLYTSLFTVCRKYFCTIVPLTQTLSSAK